MGFDDSIWEVAPSEHALVVVSRLSTGEPNSSPIEDGELNALVGPPGGPGPIAPPLRPPGFLEPRPARPGPPGPVGPSGPPDPVGPQSSWATIPPPSTVPTEPVFTTVTVIRTPPAASGTATSSCGRTLPVTSPSGASTTPVLSSVRDTTISTWATPGTFTTIISAPLPTFLISDPAVVTSVSSTCTAVYSTTDQSCLSTTTAWATPTSITMEPGSRASQDEGATNDHQTLVITLSSVLSVVGLVVIAIGVYLVCLRNRRARRRLPLFNRGITPIHDDEIATWKINRPRSEKSPARYTTRNPTAYTHKKASSQTPSLIQYQNPGKASLDYAPHSPRSFLGRHSSDIPQSPQSAVLAKAPNARTGLTDQAVPGDDPFLPAPRRQPSRLHKLPSSPVVPQRSRGGSRSNSMRSFAEVWYGENMSLSPRASSEVMPASTRGTSSRVYSTSTAPPRLSLTDDMMGGLSPPPPHRTEIGRALG